MNIITTVIAVLATAQADPQPTQNEQLERLQWELQEMLTDEEWKPERVGVDEIPAEVV